MKKLLRPLVSVLGLAAMVAMSVFLFAVPAGAQDATASPMASDMGDCVKALGIGKEGDACVDIIHASPDAPNVDVYVNGEKALENVAFGQFSGWMALPAGDYHVQVTPTGKMADAAVIDANVTLEAGAAYQVAAVGTVDKISAQVYQTDLHMRGDKMASIRVIHASPDAPAVDIAPKGGDALISNLAFPDASDYLDVPAGTYDLDVRPAGTMDVALALPGVKLEAGMVYDVFAIGQVSDGSLTVLVIPSTTTAPAMATPAA